MSDGGDVVMRPVPAAKGCTVCDGCASFSPGSDNERVCGKPRCGHREAEHAPCVRKQYQFTRDQVDGSSRCLSCGLDVVAHVAAEDAPCVRKQYQFTRDQVDGSSRCLSCGLDVVAHVAAEHAPCSLTQEQLLPHLPSLPYGRCSGCGLDVGRHLREEELPAARRVSVEDIIERVVDRKLINLQVSTSTVLSAITPARAWEKFHRKREVSLSDFVGLSPFVGDMPEWYSSLRREAGTLSGPESELQKLWDDGCSHCSSLESTSRAPVLEELKPDLCVRASGRVASSLTVEAVLELKAPKDSLTPSDRGEVLSYLDRILSLQPERQHVYGALENGKKGVLFCLSRDQAASFLTYTCPLTGDELDCMLFRLITASSEELGTRVVNFSARCHLSVIKPLGTGATCTAFKALAECGDVVVVKHYASSDTSTEHFNREVFALERLSRHSVPHVPTKIAAEFPYLVVRPRGHKFPLSHDPSEKRLFKFEHCAQLMTCLKRAHAIGLVHRDVRPSNFFFVDGAGTLLLNDWGASAQVGVCVRHQGCPESYRHPDIDPNEEYNPFPNQDLYSFVLSVCHIVAGYCPSSDGPPPPEAWRRVLGSTSCRDDPVYDDVLHGIRAIML